ncbi:MAG: class I SAM-dependent methyltransferase [Chloroflexi bacterium]|nr:class I SAM-dependent methyltransferase [Chloroflexota bacterium]
MNRTLPRQRLVGTALLSASALLLEIALTRLFSLLYFPPYVYFIISVSILGVGIGAALPAIRPALAAEVRLALYAVAAAFATFLLLLLATLAPAASLQIPLFALLALTFACFGLAVSSIFSLHPAAGRVLYMADLLGAGVGALLAIPLLNQFGAVNAGLVAVVGFSLAGVYFAAGRQALAALGALGLFALAFAANAAADILPIDLVSLTSEKPIVAALQSGGEILESRWDAFARTDLLDPGAGQPLRIYVDGGAASIMPSQARAAELMRDIGFFPFATEQPERVFILGPGAGLDVFFARQGRARAVTAVEVNRAATAIVDEWRAYNGGVYASPGVTVIVDDGRSALRRSDEEYDLIYLSQVVTLAAERGGYALSENAIYTVDAFAEYLSHLADGGHIALKLYDEVTLTRALSTALAALRLQGLDDQRALSHLMAFVDDKSTPPVPLLLIGERAFDEDDSLVLGAIARDVGFTPLLLPHVLAQPPLDTVADGAQTFDAIVAASAADISAPSDDCPYFFQLERGIPASLLPLAAIVALLTLLLLILYLRNCTQSRARVWRSLPLYFAALGVGFIALEIYAIHQTRLFLGHPTMAVTLVLVTFLVGGGIGSGLSQLPVARALRQRPPLLTALVVLLVIVWSAIWPAASRALVAADLSLRAAAAVMSLLPLTLVLGIPFPQALESAGKLGARHIAVAWSVNGLMTVVGSVAAVILSITLGFSAVFLLGGGAYALATLVSLWAQRREES